MKAIFLCESAEKIFRVFDADSLCRLQAQTGIQNTIYKKEDILHTPGAFTDVELVFSTWGMPTFTEEEIRRYLPALKCVFYGAGSVQSFARPFLNCGVKVFSAWAANAVPVAEMAVAQIVLSNKGYFLSSRVFHTEGHLAARAVCDQCRGNYGETVGIIGAGMIGKLVIGMLKQYHLNILVFDPFLPDEKAAELGVEICDLPTLFEKSFVISNHLANNEQTRGILHYGLFSRMRKNAVFINTGRGAQIVEDDLVRILQQRQDLTALLDVTFPEPPAPNHPFYTLPNCRMTPHIAGSEGDEVARMGAYMVQEFEAYCSGTPCRYEVTSAMLTTMA